MSQRKFDRGKEAHKILRLIHFHCHVLMRGHSVQGDPYGRGIVYVDSKFEVAFNCKVGLLPRPVTEL